MSQSSSRFSDPASLELHQKLRALHADDVTSTRQPTSLLGRAAYFYKRSSTRLYLIYIGKQLSQILMSPSVREGIVTAFFSVLMIGVLGVCLFISILSRLPMVGAPFSRFSIRAAHGLGLTNMLFPTMFQQLTPAELQAAKFALSQSPSQPDSNLKLFDIDIAKLLLQIASIVYERAPEPVREAMKLVDRHHPVEKEQHRPNSMQPGDLTQKLLGEHGLQALHKALTTKPPGPDPVEDFCTRHNLDYESISELNSDKAAFSSAFWDPDGSWIVLAFKGTSPVGFDEWITDFSAALVKANIAWLPGTGKVHSGFQDRVFPVAMSSELQEPYQTIRASVQLIASYLQSRQPPNTPINVYFTGHSLGCATATLAFVRAKAHPEDFGPSVVVRDAFLFAAPVVCDAAFAQEFHNAMKDGKSTMWRITNHGDVVSSALPEGGDRSNPDLADAWAFAHLGTEIKLEPAPYPSSVVKSVVMQPPTRILIHSSFTALTRPHVNVSEISLQAAIFENVEPFVAFLGFKRTGTHTRGPHVARPLSSTLLLCQEIPVFGRILAHFPMYYWDRLTRAQQGLCEWVED